MTRTISEQITWRTLALALLAGIAVMAGAQTPTAPLTSPAGARGVIRLRVRVKVADATKGLLRKRFFLIKGSLEENRTLVQSIEQRPVVSRDCYYRGLGASEALIRWLKESDCESVYCREIEQQDIEGASAIPEFGPAYAAGEKEFHSPDLARKWLAVNLPDNLRSGFYKHQQLDLQGLIKQAEVLSKINVVSVMTDRNGTAYFTDIEPGAYVISNIIPTEVGESSELWNCDIAVKAGDLATEKPFLISNRKEKNVKCVSVEKPLPICPPAGR